MAKASIYFSFIICLLLFQYVSNAQSDIPSTIDPKPFADNSNHWYGIADKKNMINALPDKPRYKPSDVKEVADNILLFQKSNGGWPKNYDMFAILTPEQKQKVADKKDILNTTFDNGTCYTQITALAIAYATTKDDRYKTGALKGLEYILAAQYENGGWPQYYPIENNYSKYITYNDGGMIGIVNLLKDIAEGASLYQFVDTRMRSRLQKAYQKSIDCILKTQINDGGKLTAWCQQHDDKTLQPVWARKFEPPSICNGESAGVVLFLMSIKNPDQKVVNAIKAAAQWFEDSKIYNTRVDVVRADSMDTPYRMSTTDRVVVKDTAAPPIWTRYYELGTHRPMFCNRDSKIVYSLAEVERERRDGYAWYTYAPQKVLKNYSKWLKMIKE
ncbi:pectate lyase [Niabella ginsengisoli]|uniref:Pectate lyase n=1 Tax=Niabella ginsengisoli TaxID=522298 RepID=A0ABS9SPM8_9BACT|nr:pectate lyase [Niabella ginsengisoli]MCH5600221.1 pectate lyase [Niabella ginsengisoli]